MQTAPSPILRPCVKRQWEQLHYHPAECKVLAILQLIKAAHTLLVGKIIHFHTTYSTLNGSSRPNRYMVGQSALPCCYHHTIWQSRESASAIYIFFLQLRQASIKPMIGIDEALAHIVPSPTHGTVFRLYTELLYARVSSKFIRFVMSFDGSSKTAKHGGFGSCAWKLWRLPE